MTFLACVATKCIWGREVLTKVSRDICCFFKQFFPAFELLKAKKKLVILKMRNVTSHGESGWGPCQCHQMTQKMSPNNTKNVTYYLNGPLLAKAKRCDVINLKKTFFNVNRRHQSSLTPLHCFDFFLTTFHSIPVVNFINVFLHAFLYERRFGSFF